MIQETTKNTQIQECINVHVIQTPRVSVSVCVCVYYGLLFKQINIYSYSYYLVTFFYYFSYLQSLQRWLLFCQTLISEIFCSSR